jgi:nitroreductase
MENLMNEILKCLYERKSIRLFTEQEITKEQKDEILDAAIQAPTAGNQGLYTILEIENQELKNTLSVLCDNQPFIAKAKLVLVFLADCQKWFNAYRYAKADYREPELGDLIIACEDAMIAAQNAVIAAESLGLGSCYIGDILENCEKITKELRLSKYVFPVAMVVFGYPTPQQKARIKPKRFPKKYMVQKNTYSDYSEKETRDMFLGRNEENDYEFERYIKAFCTRKYTSEFAMELNRSVNKYMQAYKKE